MTTPKETYHPDFKDSDADLVIECKNGVKFRVQSYVLMAHSEYFRAMPSCSASPASAGPKVVHMDCSSTDLAFLLRLVDKLDCGSSNWTQLAQALKTGERYHFKHIAGLVRHRASHCISGENAIVIFQFAGLNDYPDLAKLAIAGFSRTSVRARDHNDIPLSVCDNVPGRYGAALILAMSKHQFAPGMDLENRWERISGSFDVLKECG